MVAKCDICGESFKNEGAVRLHKYNKHNWRPEKKGAGKKDCVKAEWRFLNPSRTEERQAMEHGYSEVCEECKRECLR